MATSWTGRSKPSTSYTDRIKPTTAWDKRNNRLLQETGDFLLWEDGSKILLGVGDVGSTSWTKRND